MIERARKELELAGFFDDDSDYEGAVGEAVMELFDVFSKQGHSGRSAAIVSGIFKRLVDGEVLSPLRGTPDEWIEVSSTEPVYQNNRMYSVFASSANGDNAYKMDGRKFIDKNGVVFTCRESKVPLAFPCVPRTIYIREGTPAAEEFKHVFED